MTSPTERLRTRIVERDGQFSRPEEQAAQLLDVTIDRPHLEVLQVYGDDRHFVSSYYTDRGIMVMSANKTVLEAAVIPKDAADAAPFSMGHWLIGYDGLADAANITRCGEIAEVWREEQAW